MSLPRIKRKPVRLYVLFAFIALLLLAYLVACTPAFFRSMVLPRIAAALNSDVTAGDVSFRPLTSLRLRSVRITPSGKDPLFAAEELTLRYSLFALIRGRVQIHELKLVSPQVTLVEYSDGKSNSDVLRGNRSAAANLPQGRKPPPRIEIHNLLVSNGLLRHTRLNRAGVGSINEISQLSIGLDQLQNGGAGKVSVGGNVRLEPSGADRLMATAQGSFDVSMADDFSPSVVKGGLNVDIGQATGIFADASQLQVALEADLAQSDLKFLRMTLRQKSAGQNQGGQQLAQVKFSGPIDASKSEAHLAYEAKGIDRRLLNLAGGLWALDFATTTVDGSGRIDISQLGQLIASSGKFKASELRLKSATGTSPVLESTIDYHATIQLDDKVVLIQKLDIAAQQNGNPLITGGLDRPMNLSWASGGSGFRESTFTLKVDRLELTDWQNFLGKDPPSGQFSLQLNAQAEKDGRLLKMRLAGAGERIAWKVGTNWLRDATVSFKSDGSFQELNALLVENFQAVVRRDNATLISLNGLANYTVRSGEGGVQANADVDLPASLRAVPSPHISAQSGRLQVAGQYTQRAASTNLSFSLTLSDFTGKSGEMEFRDYQSTVQFNGDLQHGVLNIGRASLAAQSGTVAGGSLDVDGTVNFEQRTARIAYKSVNLTESAIGPFVAAALHPRQLRSVALDVSGTVQYSATGDSRLETVAQVSKLVVDDPSGRLPKAPFSASLNVNGGMRGSVVDVQKAVVAIGPTPRAQNLIRISGKLDLSPTNAQPSDVQVQSDEVDLTQVYDLFFGNEPRPKSQAMETPAAQTASVEPPPIHLPIRRLNAVLDIKKLFLRELAMKDWTVRARLSNDLVQIDPFRITLQNTPLTAALESDLSAPGYRYRGRIDGDNLPLGAINDAFNPGQRDRYKGFVSAHGQFEGAGMTGQGVQQNLRGHLDVVVTNLNLAVTNVQSPLVKTTINVIASVPDLIRNPGSALVNMFSKLSGQGRGGLSDELTRIPLEALTVKLSAGEGRLNVERAFLGSPAYQVEGSGTIQLAPVFTNSTLKIPLRVSLRQDLADRIGLASAGLPTNGTYVRLPQFVGLKGTIGSPGTDINYSALAVSTLNATGGGASVLPQKTVDKVGEAVKSLENLLSGKDKSGKSAPEKKETTPATSQKEGVKEAPKSPDVPTPKPK